MTMRSETIYKSVNPSTGEIFATYNGANGPEIEATLSQAVRAYQSWSKASHSDRAAALNNVADAIEAERDALALLAAQEMGKPIRDGRTEVLKCASLCRYYAEEGEAILAPRRTEIDDGLVTLVHQPLGLIFSVTPWNFPFWQVLRAAVPTMVAGNVVLNKPAPNVIGCALAIVAIAEKAGIPKGVLQTINTDNSQSADIIKDPRVKGVALTGSEKAGASVAGTAGGALKKTVLELGGSDPFIVMADADIAAAAAAAAKSRFTNAGQVCIASKRLIVAEEIADAFTDAFLAETQNFTPASPEAEATRLGPMARGDLRDQLDEQTSKTIAGGADIVLRGGVVDGAGYFYAPTILHNVAADSPALCEETFGPLAAIIRTRGEGEAIEAANRTNYGLSSSIWTNDEERGLRLARQIEAGGVFINTITASDPRFPFGGIGRSGYGRELGAEGVYEFCNLKTIRTHRL
ncbi:MAG: NAD-dependent succinate-semialdehyde dehydrogenase [Pseudomonadota bacterium]